ncbi:hypothetical protein HKBW3S03_00734 [Candidatus Hakubella thermalkaliphila]|uniref:Calcineurin-like phosphoesterase domain-containing protein n=1 Tax=Candidatus Hakubella thermalkaliphila TaxID=2754717 RepID=A0A6V8QA94_9ACTN|nr:metallophosphoesterase [Candidatus Hakubella thermalkaliphila]GFP19229.1 hypothetical protein HKBW3S03_00734 [Candidatus Hakubella thermalkaliphila]GFP36436.1 hypothetical protein HKBW3S44_00119 [Candidatus Hakubella thermalkaliphila]GFP38727.1 hypothetical protein HKBW3S47_00428 [Candidatus Hakubella thermalkaliphila]GFP41615.1 hypothetical protein HKBW3C_00741 [Candidatus Hakubella thermalkaliphila]
MIEEKTREISEEGVSICSYPLTIVHISDLHVGSEYFVPDLLNRSIVEINELNPHIVVVSGDLTTQGFKREYNFVKRYLDQIECPNIMVTPGNHDSRNVGYLHFEEIFGERYQALNVDCVTVVGADSSEPDLDNGQIGREHYGWITRMFSSNEGGIKIFVLHHHLLPIPATGRERNIVTDAGDVLEVLIEAGVNLVLCGHKHVPYLWRLENMLIVNAGTVSSLRLRGNTKPCYNIIKITLDHIQIIRKYPFAESVPILDLPREVLDRMAPINQFNYGVKSLVASER